LKSVSSFPEISRRSALLGMIALATVRTGVARAADEVLPSWNDGPTKQAIIKFVQQTNDTSSAQFVLPEQRIAPFDQAAYSHGVGSYIVCVRNV